MVIALSDDRKLAVAARYAKASRTNDAVLFRELCAEGSVTWHNFDGVEVPTEKTIRTIAWLHASVSALAWSDVALHVTPTGFVSQTVMTGIAAGGPLDVQSCVIVTLNDDGLITRAEEYLDSAHTAVLRG